MKKLILICLSMFFVAVVNANNITTEIVLQEDAEMQELLDAEASAFDIVVWATDAVDELCNAFNGTWADTILTVYCSFGGDPYVCTAYAVYRAACGINGAVRLTIKGDYNAALKSALTSSTKVYSVYKVSEKVYEIK